jgi:hypothetical protein
MRCAKIVGRAKCHSRRTVEIDQFSGSSLGVTRFLKFLDSIFVEFSSSYPFLRKKINCFSRFSRLPAGANEGCFMVRYHTPIMDLVTLISIKSKY